MTPSPSLLCLFYTMPSSATLYIFTCLSSFLAVVPPKSAGTFIYSLLCSQDLELGRAYNRCSRDMCWWNEKQPFLTALEGGRGNIHFPPGMKVESGTLRSPMVFMLFCFLTWVYGIQFFLSFRKLRYKWYRHCVSFRNNKRIWCLYTLWSDHHYKSSSHPSPYRDTHFFSCDENF